MAATAPENNLNTAAEVQSVQLASGDSAGNEPPTAHVETVTAPIGDNLHPPHRQWGCRGDDILLADLLRSGKRRTYGVAYGKRLGKWHRYVYATSQGPFSPESESGQLEMFLGTGPGFKS